MRCDMRTSHGALPLLVLCTGLLACTPDIVFQAPPSRVIAEFDPGASPPRVPTPNDLAFDPKTGFLSISDQPEDTLAELEFNRYLRTLDGFPVESSARVTFSGEIDPASITPSAVRILDITDPAGVTPVTAGILLSWEASRLELRIRAPWSRARQYAIALLSGEGGLQGTGGTEVVGSAAFALVRSRASLVTCQDVSAPGCRSKSPLLRSDDAELERTRAVALEQIRLSLQPTLQFLEDNGVLRTAVVSAFTFRTVAMGVATFDPERQVIPFPNDLLMEAGRVKIPSAPEDDLVEKQMKAGLNELDGFSTTASILTESGRTVGAADVRLAPESLKAKQFLLIDLDHPGSKVSFTVSCRACGASTLIPGADPDQIALLPDRPLLPHTRYAVLWLRGVTPRGGGEPINASGTFALWRLSAPLAVGGKSQLSALDDATAASLEPYRQRTQEVMAQAAAASIPLEEVLLGWTFTTASMGTALAELRTKPERWGLAANIVGGPGAVTEPAEVKSLLAVYPVWSTHIRTVLEGLFTSGNALDPNALEYSADGTFVPTEGPFTEATLGAGFRPELLRFTLVLPKAPAQPPFPDKLPVVVFQHGLGGSRRDAVLIANTVAKHGMATLSIDAPQHGLRSYCRNDRDCSSGACNADHRCPGGYVVRTFTLSGFTFPDPLGTPAISGQSFGSMNNFATRDHFRQQVIDLAQLIRVARDPRGIGAIDVDDPATPGVVERLDVERPRFIGESLGGILGTLVMAAVPEFGAATLNVPGASPVDIAVFGSPFAAQVAAMTTYLQKKGIAKGSQAYEDFLDHARWALDLADPQNFGRYLIASPLRDALTQSPGPAKRIFVSWIENDKIVPNFTTQLLLNSIDATPDPAKLKQKMYRGGNHAFLVDIFNNPALAELAQEEAVDWVVQP